MLPRQPLRFLLADDPAPARPSWRACFIKELIARGDSAALPDRLPGSLAEQWQDELYRRFHLPFEILTNDKLEAARTGNWFLETNLVIARLDKLSRNEDVQQKLQRPTAAGTCRLRRGAQDVGHLLRRRDQVHEALPARPAPLGLTRHFLLMTATPHNGKEEDFQLFMALLDGDRSRAVSATAFMQPTSRPDAPDGEGEPAQVRRHAALPERIAYTVPYKLSDAEARSTRQSPTTCARSSTAPRRSRTTSAPARSASR
jgi:hypothetical protein